MKLLLGFLFSDETRRLVLLLAAATKVVGVRGSQCGDEATFEKPLGRLPGSSTTGLPDCVQVVSIGAVPAIVVILYVGAMPGDGRQKAEEQK